MLRTLQITNAIALVPSILINYLSNLGVLNSSTISDISKRYDTLFSPAGYAYSIWGLIYLLLFAFVVYYGPLVKTSAPKELIICKIGVWFIISCLANSLWVLAWIYDHLLSSVVLMTILLISLIKNISVYIHHHTVEHKFIHLFFVTPFSIYLGQVSFALIANMAICLKKAQWGIFGTTQQEEYWTILLISIATFINMYILWKYSLYFTALVAVWALTAIAVSNKENNLLFTVLLFMDAFILVNIIIRFIMGRKRNLRALGQKPDIFNNVSPKLSKAHFHGPVLTLLKKLTTINTMIIYTFILIKL